MPVIKRFAVVDSTGRNAHSHQIRAMFALAGGSHLPDAGHPGLCLPGRDQYGRECSVFAWIEPKPADQGHLAGMPSVPRNKRNKSSQHRIMCECPGCGAKVSAGRLFQHLCRSAA